MSSKTIQRLMTEAEVMSLLALKSRKVLWQLRRAGKLSFVQLGRTVRYREQDVLTLIKRSTRERG